MFCDNGNIRHSGAEAQTKDSIETEKKRDAQLSIASSSKLIESSSSRPFSFFYARSYFRAHSTYMCTWLWTTWAGGKRRGGGERGNFTCELCSCCDLLGSFGLGR